MGVTEDIPGEWWAEPSENNKGTWQPTIQVPGCCLNLDIWFANKQECDDFINIYLIGATRSD